MKKVVLRLKSRQRWATAPALTLKKPILIYSIEKTIPKVLSNRLLSAPPPFVCNLTCKAIMELIYLLIAFAFGGLWLWLLVMPTQNTPDFVWVKPEPGSSHPVSNAVRRGYRKASWLKKEAKYWLPRLSKLSLTDFTGHRKPLLRQVLAERLPNSTNQVLAGCTTCQSRAPRVCR